MAERLWRFGEGKILADKKSWTPQASRALKPLGPSGGFQSLKALRRPPEPNGFEALDLKAVEGVPTSKI